MKLAGTFDGQRYEDIRILIPKSIKEYYEKRGEWDSIVKYRSYERCESITVCRKHLNYIVRVKQRWYQTGTKWILERE